MCLQCTETILKTTCTIHKQAQETPQHLKHSQTHETPYIRPATSKTVFPTVTKEPLRPKFELKFEIKKRSYVPPMHRNYTQNNLHHTQTSTGNTTTPQTQPKI